MKRLTLIAAVLIAAALMASPATAQDWPKKQPIKLVVATVAGGGTDVLARITAEYLQRRLGQAVVVENRPGASAAIGTDLVAKAAPDGYTLFFTNSELPVLPAVRNVPYKFDEFTYLMRAFNIPILMLGSPKLPVSSTQELVTYMKANPGKVRYGSTGVGAVVHMGIAMFESGAGVKGVHIPYPGSAPIYTDMLGGNVDITQAAPPISEGLKVLGSAGTKRHPAYPNLPTLEEIGIKNAGWDLWYGVVGPPNLPKPIADRLIQELTAVFNDPEAVAKYVAAAKVAPDLLIGEAFKKSVLEQNSQWKAVVAREKIVVQ